MGALVLVGRGFDTPPMPEGAFTCVLAGWSENACSFRRDTSNHGSMLDGRVDGSSVRDASRRLQQKRD